MTPGAPATIIDVAAAAGVSRQTVTRAMNDMPGISVATKARVLAAAAELAYRPSRFGRGLVSGGTKQLGLVI
ncbi:MAG: LacI family transcriptional regulator, partial [Frondihabitans sp.]|nr:LacI family transcriptional regulator [Frondihabitans sp.]